MTPRGWLVARGAIIVLMAADMAARYRLGHVLAADRPRQPEGAYVLPLAIEGGTAFISTADRAWAGVFEIGAVVLALAFFFVVWISRRRPRESHT
ncbi:hypothetical protein [Caulobacter sp. RHG1]|uniref:hypothetical protein n=1 Tax=Caulobacter sp. (strain RHG1) TaxID=2545762 RepID=UPI0015544366|nr:hypothetical protein [Caulobacter sp. RHG1]NQE62597.1 hypothetical protein [Caulobacter sp. RHG1]